MENNQEKKTFIWNKDWTANIRNLGDRAMEDRLIGLIIDYASTGEMPELENGPIKVLFNTYAVQLNLMGKSYNAAVEYGQTHGRKKQYDESAVAELVEAGYRAKEIAEIVGVSPDSIYKSRAWKNRKLEKQFSNFEEKVEYNF